MEIEKGTILYIERYDERQNKGTNISLEKFDGKKQVPGQRPKKTKNHLTKRY